MTLLRPYLWQLPREGGRLSDTAWQGWRQGQHVAAQGPGPEPGSMMGTDATPSAVLTQNSSLPGLARRAPQPLRDAPQLGAAGAGAAAVPHR